MALRPSWNWSVCFYLIQRATIKDKLDTVASVSGSRKTFGSNTVFNVENVPIFYLLPLTSDLNHFLEACEKKMLQKSVLMLILDASVISFAD